MAIFLTKNEELELGAKVQLMLKAESELEALNQNTDNIFDIQKRIELEQTVKDGRVAVTALVEAHTPMVYHQAHAFKSRLPSAPDIEDLAQEGMIGLMKSVYKFDPSMNNKFSTVAYYWIRQAIGRGTNTTSRLVRLPENRVADYINIKRTQDRLKAEKVALSEIDKKVMEELNLSKAEFLDITNAASNHASLNKVVNDTDGNTKELMDYVGQLHTENSSEETVVNNELFQILNNSLVNMSQVKKDIVSASFMMDFDGDAMTPKLVREKHGLTSQRFKKLLNETLSEIHSELSSKNLKLSDFMN